MSQMIAKLFCFFFGLSLCLPAWSEEVRGRFFRGERRIWLEKFDGSRVRLEPATRSIARHFNELESGDYLLVNGDLAHHSLRVFEIQFVGLTRLFGSWVSQDGSQVEIVDFNNIHWRSQADDQFYTIHYTLAPNPQQDAWTMFLVRKGEILTGRMRQDPKNVYIDIWVNEALVEAIHLKRVQE